jgi:hypothetical protein
MQILKIMRLLRKVCLSRLYLCVPLNFSPSLTLSKTSY